MRVVTPRWILPCTLLLAAMLARRAHTQQPTPAAPARRTLLVGRVVDGTSGGVIPGASIEVRSPTRGAFATVVIADSAGAFAMELPSEASYALFAKRLGYAPVQRVFAAAGDT